MTQPCAWEHVFKYNRCSIGSFRLPAFCVIIPPHTNTEDSDRKALIRPSGKHEMALYMP